MHIEFGVTADGSAWAGAGTRAVAGRLRMGPRSLVQLLQTRLGLTHPPVEQSVRIAQYLRIIEQTMAAAPAPEASSGDDPADEGALFDDAFLTGDASAPSAPPRASQAVGFWPARSVAVDPWNTARQLLAWRDAVVEAGWRMPAPGVPLPARLATLRDLEQRVAVGMPGTQDARGRAATLSPSPADDLAEVIAHLEHTVQAEEHWPLGIETLRLQEDHAALPGMWPRLIELLSALGVEVTAESPPPQPQLALEVVSCLDEWSAADVAARYLSGRSELDPASLSSVTVLATGDTDVLDRTLRRRGLPAAGRVEPSTDRAHHQVLGLFLDVATAPIDVHLLAALLDLRVLPAPSAEAEPVGLVPAPTRRRLLRALTQEPGVGGPAWRRAMDQLAQDASGAEDSSPARTAWTAALEIDRLVTDPLQADALRPDAIARRLDWLAGRLRTVSRGQGELLESLTQVRTLQQVLGMLDPAAPLSRRTLAQIIDACGGSGPSPRSGAQVSPWQVTTRAAHVPDGTRTVLWWSPEGGESPAGITWDSRERETLEAGGARVLPPEQHAALHMDAALRGIRRAEQVIAILPGRRCESSTDPSGLLTHLESSLGRGEQERRTPASLISEDSWELGGVRRRLSTPEMHRPERPTELARTIPPRDGGAGAHLLPDRLSFSQAETLISCPQHWVFEYALGIRPAQVAALPSGSRMIGTLVHAVVETLVHERWDEQLGGASLTPPSAEEIGAVFDRLVPQLASELDLPGRAAERARIRERAQRSLTELFTRTSRAGLRLTGTETRFDKPLDLPLAGGARTVRFVGSRDVDALDAAGHPTILDLKWSRNRSRYGDLFDTGEAIQLASYAWSLGEGAEVPAAQVGYFLLYSGDFVAADRQLDPSGRTPMDVADAFDRMVRAVAEALDEIADGTVRAGCRSLLDRIGLDVDSPYDRRRRAVRTAREQTREAGGLLVENHCAIGDYAQLCGLAGDWR